MRLLLSYHYYKEADLDELLARFPVKPQVFADSGAFSALTTGAAIDLKDYAAWIRRWEHHFDTYVGLDVIGDAEGTARNQARLELMGLRPIPVFHVGSDFAELEKLCARYPYVALGGMVGAGPKVLRWAVRCFQIAKGTGTVFHGFGQTKLDVISALPWFSVDSSSWASGHMFGVLTLWDDARGRWVKIEAGNHRDAYTHAKLLREHGGDPKMLGAPGVGLARERGTELGQIERRAMIGVNVVAWYRLERWLQRRHSVTPPEGWPYAGPGPIVYLAASGSDHSEQRLAGLGPNVYLAITGGDPSEQRLAGLGPNVYLAAGFVADWLIPGAEAVAANLTPTTEGVKP